MLRYVVFLMYATSLVMQGLLMGRVEAPAREWEYGLEMTEIPANYEQYLPPQVVLVPMSVPSNYNALAYQHHTSITKVSSPQYKLVSQAICTFTTTSFPCTRMIICSLSPTFP